MAIGTPALLGSNAVSDTAATIVITTTVVHTAGDKIVVTGHNSVAARTLDSVTDSAGNTYTVDSQSGTNRRVAIASSEGAVALASGGTITLTFSATGTASKKATAHSVSGLAAGIDVAPAATTGTAAGWSAPATGTLAQADEIVWGAITRGSAATNTPTSPWVEAYDDSGNSSTGVVEYQIVAATTSVTPQGTFSAGGTGWDAITVSYKATAAAAEQPWFNPVPRNPVYTDEHIHRASRW